MAAEGGVFVFDACAFIAFLEDEPGAAVVEKRLDEPSCRCLIHALNACEIYIDLHRRGYGADASALEAILLGHGLELVDSISADLWRRAGQLKARWRRVSLADCFALALAIEARGTLVTSDHHELDPIAAAGVCPVEFIR